jgi:hypothetical protein
MIAPETYQVKGEIMSQNRVYQQIHRFLGRHLPGQMKQPTLKRLALLVTGITKGVSALPAHIAATIKEMELSSASTESIERRVRRVENDPNITVHKSFYPLVQIILKASRMEHLTLILDPTTQKDHIVMVSVSAWYRGRALPLAWTTWPGNKPLEGAGFWKRIEALLGEVAPLLPKAVPVVMLADRAFGSPAFTDLVSAHGWDWIVRVQSQTVYRDRCGREAQVVSLVRFPGQRKKLRGQAFKKAGWRECSIVVYWGKRHSTPLCLASSLPPKWSNIHWYRQRFPIESSFRDYKSFGFRWEQVQVRDLEHMQRLLIGMALAAWLTILLGAQKAAEVQAIPPTGKRRTRCWWGKRSIFRLGLIQFEAWAKLKAPPELPSSLPDWEHPNWSAQARAHHARAFVFA